MANLYLSAYTRYLEASCDRNEDGSVVSLPAVVGCLSFSEWLGFGRDGGASLLELLQFRGDGGLGLPSGASFVGAPGGECVDGSDFCRAGEDDARVSFVRKPGLVDGGRGGSVSKPHAGLSAGRSVTAVDADSCGDRGVGVIAAVVGKHYRRNKLKRENRKSKKVTSEASSSVSIRQGAGYFSACSDDVRQSLRDSRAKMLVAQNELKTEQSLAAVKHVAMLRDTRVNEVDFELKRLTLEDKLASISEKRGIVSSERAVASPMISTSPPALLGGSVSPSSSISMAEERKLRQSVVDQAGRLKELEAELISLRSVPKSFKHRTHNVSEWTYKSPYDNFTVDGIHKSKLPGYVRGGGSVRADSLVDGGQDFQFQPYDC